jgi:hypothetical protein
MITNFETSKFVENFQKHLEELVEFYIRKKKKLSQIIWNIRNIPEFFFY